MTGADILALDPQNETPIRCKPGTNSRWEKLCSKCDEWVGIGQNQNLYSFFIHLDGERCRRNARLKAQVQTEEAPQLSVIPMTMTGSLSDQCPHSPSHTSPQPIFPYPVVQTTIASPVLPPLSPLPPLNFAEHTASDTMVVDSFQVAASPPASVALPCYGARVKWECGNTSKTYPFQYHDTGYPTWSVSTQRPPDTDTVYLRSFSCTLFHNPLTEACFECLKIPSSDKFQSLARKALNYPAPTVPWNYLTWDQLRQRLKDRTNECRQYRKKVKYLSLPRSHR